MSLPVGVGRGRRGLSGSPPDTAQASEVSAQVVAHPELLGGGLFPHSTVPGCPAPGLRGWCPAPGAQAWLGHGGPQDILRKCTQLHGRRSPSVHKAWMPEDSTHLSVPPFTGPAAPDPSRFPVTLFCSEAGRSQGTAAFRGSHPMERFLNPNHRSPPTGLCPQVVVGRSSGKNLTSSSARGWPLLVPGGGNQAAEAHSWVWRAFYFFFFFKKFIFVKTIRTFLIVYF